MKSKDRLFRLRFDTDKTFKTKFNKTKNHFKPKAEVTPVEQEIYYDEVIYYDGGNIEGYGDD